MAKQKSPPRAGHRILALDVGSRRIGLAVTGELGVTAQGLRTLERSGKRKDLEILRKIARKYEVGVVVVGRPVRMGGDNSLQTQRVDRFASALRDALGLPVEFFDERLTSWEANELLDPLKLSRIERKGKVDQVAATLILQGYLQQKTLTTQAKSENPLVSSRKS